MNQGVSMKFMLSSHEGLGQKRKHMLESTLMWTILHLNYTVYHSVAGPLMVGR